MRLLERLRALRSGGWFLMGVTFLATGMDPVGFKRCGCDKEEVAQFQEEYLRLTGRAYDFETDASLAGVRITIGDDWETVTGADGRFEFDQVRMGTWPIRIERDGYDPREKTFNFDRDYTAFDIPLAMVHVTPLGIEDTFTWVEEGATNYSIEPYLVVSQKELPFNKWQTYLRFSTPNVPEDAEIEYAGFVAWGTSNFNQAARHTLCPITEMWDPSQVRYIDRPSVSDMPIGRLISSTIVGTENRLEFDVTDVISAYRNPGGATAFGVQWNWDQNIELYVASTEYLGGGTAQALAGTIWWYSEPPDFPAPAPAP